MQTHDYKDWLQSRYERMPPKYKKYLGWLLLGILVAGGLYITVSQTSPKHSNRQAKPVTRNIIGQKDMAQQFAVGQVNTQVERMLRENKALKDKIDQLVKKEAAVPVYDAAKMQLEVTKRVQQELGKQGAHEKEKKEPGAQKLASGQRTATGPAGQREGKPGSAAKPRGPGGKGGPGVPGAAAASGAKEIKVIGASSEGKGKMQVKEEKKDVETFLPAGSIFSGTLITGLDVSCGKSSKKDPFPVLLRVKKEAILPNFYRADVRECFLIAAGYGDLGSERAYLRGERLSCIRADGKAIETKIDMYAVGEDGKAGVRGRLVSKTGALLSKALLAGFMEGFSKVFTKSPVTVIATGTPGQTSPFQSTLSKDSMQTAGLEGAGSALERLSKYYIDMAKDIFPVIEIDAGRAIDFVLISGKSLKLQSRKSSDQ